MLASGSLRLIFGGGHWFVLHFHPTVRRVFHSTNSDVPRSPTWCNLGWHKGIACRVELSWLKCIRETDGTYCREVAVCESLAAGAGISGHVPCTDCFGHQIFCRGLSPAP